MLFNPASVIPRVDRQQPGGSLVVYSVGRRAAALLDRSDGEIVQTYFADLYRLFPTLEGAVDQVVVRRWPFGVPVSVVGRPWLSERLRRPLGRIHFAGDYLVDVGLGMDGSVQNGFDVAAEVEAAASWTRPSGSADT
jgi:monoamine oxidase